ncbi:3D (Asp-Asp-Asp) domain-containing protein [Tumebacillus sp. BK434]|uniref:LysM peptidoglycan-binding domain-containing protein n=1 Tax=Tumebacillus sp. BK434 TaxID=2512169 RepID=UPI00104E0EAE|nr:LysM peptidoglycan-binding domain-containing protein [Tumebacillus sp. BK434]TCP55417.1 3D (Asp-Asp-Asp) domain-containing protein [Tumebacillus sp. BK434]
MKKFNLKKWAFATIVAASVLTVSQVNVEAAGLTDAIIVQPGQTLSQLAASYGTTAQAWKTANHLASDTIYAGQKLHIVFPYKVITGDQLAYLANKYDTTAAEIKNLNGMDSDRLIAGNTILIPSGTNGFYKAVTPATAAPAQAPQAKAPQTEEKSADRQALQPVKQPVVPTRVAPTPAPAPVEKPAPAPKPAVPTVAGMAYTKTLNMDATAYGPGNIMWQWGGQTFTGTKVREGVIAVDPKVVPLGSKVYVTGYNSPLLPAGGFVATAEDTGGAIKGNRIDIYIDGTQAQLRQFGKQDVKIYILK